jgi:Dolichyl-phosphate-mannose-protein mannosyltransferase
MTQDSGLRTQDFLRWWPEALGALAVLVSRLLTMPRTFWESDELLFAAALQKFDPWSSHPHPPGYPLYVGLGKFFDMVFGDPFNALVALSVVSCVIGFLALAAAFRRYLGDRTLAVCGALFFYFSSAVLVHATLPLSDGPSLMFVALVLYAATAFPDHATQRTAIGLGLACSAAIGTRPQLAVILVPMLIALLLWTRDLRKIAAGLIAFGIFSAAWFAPLMDAAGGWSKLMLWETRQAAYIAAHDAAASRGASSIAAVVSRFLAHPWGPKWIALPVFAVAVLGLVAVARLPKRPLIAPAIFSIAYFLFAAMVMDPADAARYSMPHMIGIALLFAAGLGIIRSSAQLRLAPLAAVCIAAGAALAYTAPLLRVRASQPSAPVAAADFIRRSFPPNTIVLYDLSMRPAAEYLLSTFRSAPLEKGLREVYDRAGIPVVIYADGGSTDSDARVFSWPDSDAYGKLTRNHYRVVTADPLRPPERYLPEKGVYALERNEEGEEWRWLSSDSTIRIPAAHGVAATVALKLSHDAPYDTDEVRLLVNNREVARVNVRKNASTASIPLPAEPQTELRFIAEKSFSPATALHNQDPRILAVQLLRLETR